MSAPTTSTSHAAEASELKKRFMNSSVQHGNEENADEENIVVLAYCKSRDSPIREIDEPVQREEFEYNDFLAKAPADDSMNVSTKTLPLFFTFDTFSNYIPPHSRNEPYGQTKNIKFPIRSRREIFPIIKSILSQVKSRLLTLFSTSSFFFLMLCSWYRISD